MQFASYLPYGEALADEHTVTDTQPYKFSGKELDGETGLYYFGARYYNPKLALWYGVDPLAEKYPSMGGFVYCAANSVNVVDPDGNDIVYINTSGVEVHRVKNDQVHKAHIQTTSSASERDLSIGWTEVPMPNIIQTRSASGENVSGSVYQENDYLIAARTGYFNQSKNNGTLNLYTEGGNQIPQDVVKSMPDLDPTLVKAITIQESHAGTTGISDVMQSNVKGDWANFKTNYSLEKGRTPSVTNSLYSGIRILGTKGFKGGVSYDKKSGQSTYTFQGWDCATKSYNGGGVRNYQENVKKMVDESKKPNSSNY